MKYLTYLLLPIVLGTITTATILPSFAQQTQNQDLAQQLKESDTFKGALQTVTNTSLQDVSVITILCPPEANVETLEGCNVFVGLPIQ